jgi:undecaprenyl-diphosphatase
MADSAHGHSQHRGPTRRVRQAAQATRAAALTGTRWLGRQEAAVLVAALGILLALFTFIKIAEELGEGELAHFDEWLLHLLRVPGHPHSPIGPSWLLEAAQDITALGGRTMLVAVTLFAIGYLALERNYGAMWLVGVATAGGGLLSAGMKQIFGRERPDLVPHLVAVTSSSFPSGHSLLAAILYLTLGALLARFAARRRTKVYLLTVALVAAFMIGSSRVYLGVHYPTDVLAGWCAGLVWALSCWLVARYLQARGAVGKTGA